MSDLALPKALKDELSAANARLVSEYDVPNGRRLQTWLGGRGALVLIELHPDGKTFLWQPLAGEINTLSGNAATLRAYLAGTPLATHGSEPVDLESDTPSPS